MTLNEFQKLIVPAAKALADNPEDVSQIKEKAMCLVGDQPIVDEEGNPVEIDQISLMPAAKSETPAEDPTDEMKSTIDAAVKAAVDEATKTLKVAKAPIKSIEVGGSYKIPASVKRHRCQFFKGDVDGKSAEERAYRFGQWALANIAKSMPGRFAFPGAIKFTENYITKLQTGLTDSAGGYAVPEEFGSDLIDLREQYGVVRRVFKRVPMASDSRTDPRRTGGLTAYFTTQGAAGTESTKAWDQVRLVAKDLMVIATYTNQLAEDAVISIGDDLANEISYALAYKEDDCGMNGDGGLTYGGIQGVRTRLDSVDGAGTDSAGVFTQASSNTWSAVTLSDFNNVVGKLPQYADTPNACWIAHRAFYYGVMQKLELAAGGVTAQEVSDGRRRPRPLFLGYPVEFSQVMPSATATSTISAVLGDFTLGASFGDRQQDAISFSEHATVGGNSVWERNCIAVRGVERFDINVHSVGDASTAGPIVALKTGS